MDKKPIIKVKLTPTDKILEILGGVSLVAFWVLILVNYASLPDIIPIHYNGLGEVDRYGGKGNILMLPIVATILFIGMTILNKFPHVFNYTTKITPENAEKQYTNALRILRCLKLSMVVVFGLTALQTIRSINGEISGPGVWFMPFSLALIFIPLLYFLIKSFKKTKP